MLSFMNIISTYYYPKVVGVDVIVSRINEPTQGRLLKNGVFTPQTPQENYQKVLKPIILLSI